MVTVIFLQGKIAELCFCKYQHWLALVMIILANSPVSLQINLSGSGRSILLREARRLQDRQIQLSLDRSRQWILVGPLRMSGIKIQTSSKKMRHKRRSHAFHLTLFVDKGLTREEVNPEMKCQHQVSPLRHVLFFEAKLYSCYHPSETMKGWILHRFNCISWLRILSRKQVWAVTRSERGRSLHLG